MAEEPVDVPDTGDAPTTGNRRNLIWAIVAIVSVALIFGLAYATNRGGDGRIPGADVATSGSSVVPTGTPGSSGTGSGGTDTDSPTSTMPGQPSRTGTSTTPPGTRPTEPAPQGSRLTTVTQPPAATLAMIEATKLKADARYTIVFSPFGYGPPRSGQQTLVVRIDSADPTNESAQALDFEGRNMLAAVSPAADNPVRIGGIYTGVLTFHTEGDLLIPYIADMKAKD